MRIRMKILLIFLVLIFCLACGSREEEKNPPPAPESEQALAIDPFLLPDVENVSGGEAFQGEEARVRDLIVSYNKVVTKAQINAEELTKLRDFASEREVRRMAGHIQKDRMDGKIMSVSLRKLKFLEISLEDIKGTVKTSEDWFFEDRDLKTGEIMEAVRDMEYETEYSVVKKDGKKDGKWLVESIAFDRIGEFSPPRGEPSRTMVKTGLNTK